MKQIFCSVIVLSLMFMLAGCSSGKESKLNCTLSRNDTINGYQLEASYDVTAKDDIVQNVKTKEVVTSDNETILSTFESQLKNTYSKMNENYGGYNYKVTNDGKKVIADVTIDYTKLNLKKLATDEPTMKNIMKSNNKIVFKNIKSLYEQMGASCK